MPEKIPALTKSTLKKLAQDPIATAKAIQLVYVNSKDEGIERIPAGKGFKYVLRKKPVKDKSTLQRIRSLVIPPAWKDVWICRIAEGHLQATGLDVQKRKQYRYHPMWNELRNKTKFYRLPELGKLLPTIRKQVDADLSLPSLPKEKVLAAVVSLMEKTGIRIGNEFYEKLYGSFGLTTLKDKHAEIKGSHLKFSFRGKKGVEHTVSLKSKKLAKIVQNCRDIPGKELFQYIDEEGNRQSIDSGMVNEYIRKLTGEDFTAKDLRTWCGTLAALTAITENGLVTDGDSKKKVIAVLDKVSEQLGNTRTVCKKYYVHPSLLELYEDGKLDKWLSKKDSTTKNENGLSPIEKTLVNILESL
ncbi:MAG TPA: DNA topoisomerase IB [Chitinophagaceae bacterium]|nr:DNA topoisomerase IB [Chitinophagaceae bacterium]